MKNIYFLMEHPDFIRHLGKGFTLILEEFQELAPRIEVIVSSEQGNVLFNKAYNNKIANPVLLSFRDMLGKQR